MAQNRIMTPTIRFRCCLTVLVLATRASLKHSNEGALVSAFSSSVYSPCAFVSPRPRIVTKGPPCSTALFMAQKRGRPRGPLRTIEVKPPMNDEITQPEVRVTVPNPKGRGKDETLGVMSREEALQRARDEGVDLILINANADPPVCKIVDYSKYRYMKEKAAKEKKKNSKATEVKEVKMSYKIDVHDYEVRKKNAAKFINQGNRVKCSVIFKGREVQHDNLGYDLLERLADDLQKICTMEGRPKRDGRNLSCIITPKPDVLKGINEKKRAAERAAKKKREKSRAELDQRKAEQAAASPVPMKEVNLKGELDGMDDDKTLDELLGGDDVTSNLFG